MARILIVDDEEQIRGLLMRFLTKTHFDVISVSGGLEAVELLKNGAPIDLMVLDMSMPKVSGMDVLKEKKSLNNTIPVIMLTGNINRENTQMELQQLGIMPNDIIYKPVDLFEILDLINKKLGR